MRYYRVKPTQQNKHNEFSSGSSSAGQSSFGGDSINRDSSYGSMRRDNFKGPKKNSMQDNQPVVVVNLPKDEEREKTEPAAPAAPIAPTAPTSQPQSGGYAPQGYIYAQNQASVALYNSKFLASNYLSTGIFIPKITCH